MSKNRRLHGAAVIAPDELFAPPEAPVGSVSAFADGSIEGAPRRSFASSAWSALKLLSGLLVVVGCSLAVAWSAHHYALTSRRFAIQAVDLSGARRLTPERVRALAGIALGANIFALDTDAAERRLLDDPWIAEVKITRKLPGTLQVQIAEREARAVSVIGDQLYLTTPDGVPFKLVESGDPYDLPLVTGVSPENLVADRAREVERIQTALEVLAGYQELPLSKSAPAQEVHLADSGEVTLIAGKEPTAFELGTGPFRRKLLMAARVMAELGPKARRPGVVFLDNQAHPDRVVVRMR